MKLNLKSLVVCIAVPLLVGGLSGLITGSSMEVYSELNRPSLSPPGWLFPVVWTILYVLMGVASYLVLHSGGKQTDVNKAMILYGLQLAVNFLWPVFFFKFGWYFFSFLWIVFLWVLILATIISFFRLSKPAAYLMLPYLLWVTFAAYLNFSIFIMN